MRVDHRTVADPRSSINEHRRHTRYTFADVAPVANAGSARNDSYTLIGCDLFHRESGLVHPWLAARVDRHVHHRAHTEADENSLLHPRVHAPTSLGGSVRFGCSDFARVQGPLEVFKEMKMFGAVGFRAFVEQLFDLSLHAHSCRPAVRAFLELFRSSLDSQDSADTLEAATPAPAVP